MNYPQLTTQLNLQLHRRQRKTCWRIILSTRVLLSIEKQEIDIVLYIFSKVHDVRATRSIPVTIALGHKLIPLSYRHSYIVAPDHHCKMYVFCFK